MLLPEERLPKQKEQPVQGRSGRNMTRCSRKGGEVNYGKKRVKVRRQERRSEKCKGQVMYGI
jgi:hypothetical protein